jgi:predicted NBD/HSP70 family sugar kinase
MDYERRAGGRSPLEQRPIPELFPHQLEKFDLKLIHPMATAVFRPQLEEGALAIGVDIAAENLTAYEFSVVNSRLAIGRKVLEIINDFNGIGYLDKLRDVARQAGDEIPVGISLAGPVEGTVPGYSDNVSVFSEELAQHYSGDLARLFPTLRAVENDANAGLWAASLNALQEHRARDVIYIINDLGMNASVLRAGMLYSLEAGHAELVPQLNPHNQSKKCWFHNRDHVCVEAVAAAKGGIEDILTGALRRRPTHDEARSLYFAGDPLTIELYDNSANVSAHMVQGLAIEMDIKLASPETAVVCHGEIFNFPGYSERLKQIIEARTGGPVNLYSTSEFSENASLEGAALTALSE